MEHTEKLCCLIHCLNKLFKSYISLIESTNSISKQTVKTILKKLLNYQEYLEMLSIEYCRQNETTCGSILGNIYIGILYTMDSYDKIGNGTRFQQLYLSIEALEYMRYILRRMVSELLNNQDSESMIYTSPFLLETLDSFSNRLDEIIKMIDKEINTF